MPKLLAQFILFSMIFVYLCASLNAADARLANSIKVQASQKRIIETPPFADGLQVADLQGFPTNRNVADVYSFPDDLSSPLELLNHPVTAELRPYINMIFAKIRQSWYKLIPNSAKAPERKSGAVTIEFSVWKDGSVKDENIVTDAGDVQLDEAAFKAIQEASPMSPLPNAVSTDHLVFRFHFKYNPAPNVTK